MTTDITRQLCASVYFNPRLGDKIIALVKSPYNAIVKPAGVDEVVLLKHALNAKNKERGFYWLLFIPSLILVFSFVFPPVFVVCFLIILIAVIVKDQNSKHFIENSFLKSSFNVDFSYNGSGKKLIDQLQKRTTKNVIYYSGYSPFVGCGYSIGGWSFVVDIDKGKSNMGTVTTPKPFMEDELYYRVSQELMNLKIQNSTVENKVYFNGKSIRNNKEILPDIFDNPNTEVSSEFVKRAMNSVYEDTRFYKMIQVVGWEGDLIVTAFLRVQKGERTLFVENNYYVLPPIKDEYRAIDRIKKQSGIAHFFAWFLLKLGATFYHAVMSIFYVLQYIQEGMEKLFGTSPEAKLRKTVKSSPDYDYGAKTSIREFVCQENYLQHFQKLDTERYFKTIDKRIFNGIANFLESKDIDISEFRERETSVLNNGIIVTGGSFTSGNTSTGVGAAINNILSPNKKNQPQSHGK